MHFDWTFKAAMPVGGHTAGSWVVSPHIALAAVLSNATTVWLPPLGPCLALGDQHLAWSNQAEHLEPPPILPHSVSEGEDSLASLPPGSMLPALLLGEVRDIVLHHGCGGKAD